MTKEELHELLQSDESYRIERTISTGNMDKFQEAICAFSNDLPGSGKKGYLFIGVLNDGTISGMKVDDTLMKKIAGIRSDGNILPLPVMNTEKVETEQGDVLVVTVTPSFVTPVRYRGRVFVRIGPRKDIASAEEERILTERNASHLSTFDIMPCREAGIDDIDTDYIKDKYLPRLLMKKHSIQIVVILRNSLLHCVSIANNMIALQWQQSYYLERIRDTSCPVAIFNT